MKVLHAGHQAERATIVGGGSLDATNSLNSVYHIVAEASHSLQTADCTWGNASSA